MWACCRLSQNHHVAKSVVSGGHVLKTVQGLACSKPDVQECTAIQLVHSFATLCRGCPEEASAQLSKTNSNLVTPLLLPPASCNCPCGVRMLQHLRLFRRPALSMVSYQGWKCAGGNARGSGTGTVFD